MCLCIYLHIYTRKLHVCGYIITYMYTKSTGVCTPSTCVCAYMYIHVRQIHMSVCIYLHICTRAYKCMHTCLFWYAYMSVFVRVCMGIYIYVKGHCGCIQMQCVHIQIYVYISGFVIVCVCVYIYTEKPAKMAGK